MGKTLAREQRKTIYSFKFDMFRVIDTEEKAYWLGFIYGDGSVDNYSLRIEISNKDKEHLDKFKAFMGSNNIIKETKKGCSRITLCSKELVRDLGKYGVVKNKTYKDIRTPNIPKDLIIHFYRGILDSDGWICRNFSKGHLRGIIGFSSYKKTILLEILNFLKSFLPDIKANVKTYKRYEGKWQVSQLQLTGNKLFISIYQLFYKDTIIYLNRKMVKGKNLCDELMFGKTLLCS